MQQVHLLGHGGVYNKSFVTLWLHRIDYKKNSIAIFILYITAVLDTVLTEELINNEWSSLSNQFVLKYRPMVTS